MGGVNHRRAVMLERMRGIEKKSPSLHRKRLKEQKGIKSIREEQLLWVSLAVGPVKETGGMYLLLQGHLSKEKLGVKKSKVHATVDHIRRRVTPGMGPCQKWPNPPKINTTWMANGQGEAIGFDIQNGGQ